MENLDENDKVKIIKFEDFQNELVRFSTLSSAVNEAINTKSLLQEKLNLHLEVYINDWSCGCRLSYGTVVVFEIVVMVGDVGVDKVLNFDDILLSFVVFGVMRMKCNSGVDVGCAGDDTSEFARKLPCVGVCRRLPKPGIQNHSVRLWPRKPLPILEKKRFEQFSSVSYTWKKGVELANARKTKQSMSFAYRHGEIQQQQQPNPIPHERGDLTRKDLAVFTYPKTDVQKIMGRYLTETDEYVFGSGRNSTIHQSSYTIWFRKMKSLVTNIINEIVSDIEMHDKQMLPTFVDLPCLSTCLYSSQLSNRMGAFLAACQPVSLSPLVTDLIITTCNFSEGSTGLEY
nr:mammalian uncoordinated homology 13, domain 2 [Tanacetum cinerariifolium]